MFVKINDSAICNTDQIVWVDASDDKMIVHLSDGTEHTVQDAEKLNMALRTENMATKVAGYGR